MVECVLFSVGSLGVGYCAGLLYHKYRQVKSELFDNVNLIKEDVQHLHVLFANHLDKE